MVMELGPPQFPATPNLMISSPMLTAQLSPVIPSPESSVVMAVTPESSAVMTTIPEPRHNMAATPESPVISVTSPEASSDP